MNVKIYQCTADNRVVDKTNYLSLEYDIQNATFKKQTSSMDLSIDITTGYSDIIGISNCNYIYVEEFDTWYYIHDYIIQTGHVITLECHEDVLMTYKEQIKNLSCIIARQENRYNQYLNDPNYKVYNYRRVQTLEFPNGFNKNNSSYILSIAGGN